MTDAPNAKSMSIIVTKGTLDWAYPPFILATTAAAMGLEVTMFFTFYGLQLLKRDLNPKINPLGNAAMEMPMAGGHMAMPNILAALPGATALTTGMMKTMLKKKGVPTIAELRSLALEADVNLIACQMTMDLFEYTPADMIEGITLGGAATWVDRATRCDINLYI